MAPALHAQPDSSDARVVIHVDSLDRAAFTNVAELLQARVSGLTITRDGDGGLHWYMRGQGSYSGSAPLVLVDDIRVNVARTASPELAGRATQLEEIDIEDVERIEVLSGPATAAAYGTGAGHGVIRIFTFRPRAQAMAWRLFTSVGAIDDNVTYPGSYYREGTRGGTDATWHCTHFLEASGGCTPTGPISVLNPLETESPFERALAARVGGAVTSMTGPLAWRGGATFDREGSTTGRLASQRLHAHLAASLSPTSFVDATVRAYWTRGNADPPSNLEPSLLIQGLFARDPGAWDGFTTPPSSDFTSSREGLVASARWRVAPWLESHLAVGASRLRDEDDVEFFSESIPGFPRTITRHGERRLRESTGRLGLSAAYGMRALSGTSTIAVERSDARQEEHFEEFVRANGSFSGRAFFSNIETDLTGVAFIQQLHLWERARLSGGVRLDRVRLGDEDWDSSPYPRAAVMWDVKRFVPSALGGIRLRAALGDVGNVPQVVTPFLRFLPGFPAQPTVELTREREAGIDVAAAYDRLKFSLTWYTKRTSDVGAIMTAVPAYVSLELLNRGIEGHLHTTVVARQHLSWDVLFSYAYNHNELRRINGPPFTMPSPLGRQYFVPGAPVAAHGTFDVAEIQDLNGNGALDSACPVEVGGCEVLLSPLQFGAAFPPTVASLETRLRIGALTIAAVVDHRGGHYRANVTNAARCFDFCLAAYDPATPSYEQARLAAIRNGINESSVEDASFTKLREISLRFTAPARWADALGASRLEISLAGRNVATWTDYSGLDPEAMSMSWSPLVSRDFAATPVPRRVAFRVTAVRE